MDIARITGHWDAAGLRFSILERDGAYVMVDPSTPSGFEPTLDVAGPDRARIASGPYAGTELVVTEDEDGETGLLLGDTVPTTRLPNPPDREPGSGLTLPPLRLTPDQERAFARIWDGIVADPDGQTVDDPALHPLQLFVRWLGGRGEVIFHGSNDPDIDVFEPVRRSMEIRDHAGRGNLGAVYGTHDGIWSMFFAVVDRSRLKGSIRNGVGTYRRRGGDDTVDVYRFSIADVVLDTRPYTTGALYLLPRSAFSRIPIYPGGPPSNEWACPTTVTPLARLTVEPEDFPFLESIGGHDDGPLIEFGRLGDEVYADVVSARRTDDGIEVVTRADREVVDRLIEMSREIFPDVVRVAEDHPDGTTVRMTGPPAFLQGMERRLSEHLGD
jgi:hypothetical protein